MLSTFPCNGQPLFTGPASRVIENFPDEVIFEWDLRGTRCDPACDPLPIRRAIVRFGECQPIPPNISCSASSTTVFREPRLRFSVELQWPNRGVLRTRYFYTYVRDDLDLDYRWCGQIVLEEDILQDFATWYGQQLPVDFPLLKDRYNYSVTSCPSPETVVFPTDSCGITAWYLDSIRWNEGVRDIYTGTKPSTAVGPSGEWVNTERSFVPPPSQRVFTSFDDMMSYVNGLITPYSIDQDFGAPGCLGRPGRTEGYAMPITGTQSFSSVTIWPSPFIYLPSSCVRDPDYLDTVWQMRQVRTRSLRMCISTIRPIRTIVNGNVVCTPNLVPGPVQCVRLQHPPQSFPDASPPRTRECRLIRTQVTYGTYRVTQPATITISRGLQAPAITECLCGVNLNASAIARILNNLGAVPRQLGLTFSITDLGPC